MTNAPESAIETLAIIKRSSNHSGKEFGLEGEVRPAAFSEVKTLEISSGIAGLYLTILLSDLAAEVIKVEAPR